MDRIFRIIRIFKEKSRVDFWYLLILFLIFVAFVIIWYNVAVFRLYDLYAAVFDLGIAAERIWLPLHSAIGIRGLAYSILYGSIIPYILSPLSVFNSLKLLLFVQTIFIWGSVFPIYAIARKKKLSPLVSLFISISYFFYFPLAGLNFFDFHMEAFFPFFFLLAYAFYIYEFRILSLLFFVIAALTKFPFDIFVALFGIEEIFFYFRNNTEDRKKQLLIPAIILIVSMASLIAGEMLSLAGPHNVSQVIHSSTIAVFPLGSLMLTLFLIFGSVIFLPLYSKRWLLFFIPYIALSAITRNPAYEFPDLLSDQYSALFIAFIFLGIIDVLSRISEHVVTKNIPNAKNKRYRYHITIPTRTVLTVLIILIIMSLAFQPWSPVIKDNSYTNYYYSTNPYDNSKTYAYLSEEANLIPRTNPYVLVPNNIPEAYPRALINGPYRVGELVMGFPSPVFENITIQDAINNTFPYIAWNGTVVGIPLDYAWGTITDAVFYSDSGYQSMFNIMQIMLESGKYGVMAEANGTIVLQRGYTSPPALYIPMNHFLSPNTGSSDTHFTISNDSYNFNNVSSGKIIWYGGTIYPPGTYNNTLNFCLSKGFSGNISIEEVLNNSIVASKYINTHAINDMRINISFEQKFYNVERSGYCYFIVKSNGFRGRISFNGVMVTES